MAQKVVMEFFSEFGIEIFNGYLGGMIKKFVSQHKQDWDQHLQLLVAAYRVSPHPATGFSPNYLMFGKEVNLPSYILFPFLQTEAAPDLSEYV